MSKFFYILLGLMLFICTTQAQKKILYEDTSLLQKDEQITVSPPEVDYTVSDTIATTEILQQKTAEEAIQADTTLYKNNLAFSQDSIKKWRNLKEYAYTKYLDSLLRGIKPKELKAPRVGFLSSLFNSGLLGILMWSVVIAVVVFVLYRLFLAEGTFKRKSKSANKQAEVEEEIITAETDFEALIKQAVQSSNYRHAVRYQYLRTLHLLAGKNLVELSPDKTNYQYVNEIKDRSQQQTFAALTLHYEYVWYGGFEIDNGIYYKIENGFTGFNQKI